MNFHTSCGCAIVRAGFSLSFTMFKHDGGFGLRNDGI
jgi:hypothetical protein